MSLFQTQDFFSQSPCMAPLTHTWCTSVVGPSPNGPHFCHMRYIHPGGVSGESAQLSRLETVVVASPKLLDLCSVCLHQWRVPQFALKYPSNPHPTPTPGGRPLLGDRLPVPGGGGSRATGLTNPEWLAHQCIVVCFLSLRVLLFYKNTLDFPNGWSYATTSHIKPTPAEMTVIAPAKRTCGCRPYGARLPQNSNSLTSCVVCQEMPPSL